MRRCASVSERCGAANRGRVARRVRGRASAMRYRVARGAPRHDRRREPSTSRSQSRCRRPGPARRSGGAGSCCVSRRAAGGLLVAFREVLLPFVLAIVLAYVLSPVVNAAQQLRIARPAPPRWVVVLALYADADRRCSQAWSWFSAPRLAAELGRLSKEAPRMVATVRKEWLPELDRRAARGDARRTCARAARAGRPPRRSQAGAHRRARDRAVDRAARSQVRPRAEGGYEVVLPPRRPARRAGRRSRASGSSRRGPRDKRRLRPDAPRSRRPRRARWRTPSTPRSRCCRRRRASDRRSSRGDLRLRADAGALGVHADHAPTASSTSRARCIAPGRRGEFDDLVRRIDRGLSGVVRGQLIICVRQRRAVGHRLLHARPQVLGVPDRSSRR